jgi:hypothetical protein
MLLLVFCFSKDDAINTPRVIVILHPFDLPFSHMMFWSISVRRLFRAINHPHRPAARHKTKMGRILGPQVAK